MPKSILSMALGARRQENPRYLTLYKGEVNGPLGQVVDVNLRVKIKSINDEGEITVEVLGGKSEEETEEALQKVTMVGRVPSP